MENTWITLVENMRVTTPDIQQAMDSELALLRVEVRSDRRMVDSLLDPDFLEIGASGRLWSRQSTISAIAAESPHSDGDIQVTDMRGIQLSPDLILLTYVTESSRQRVRRSSLWQRTNGSWKLLFHQGTPSSVSTSGS